MKKYLAILFCAMFLTAFPLSIFSGSAQRGDTRNGGDRILYVDANGGSTYKDIQGAVDDAGPHTTIIVNPGGYSGFTLVNKRDITVEGNSSDIEEIKVITILSVHPTVVVSHSSNITLQNMLISGMGFSILDVSYSDNITLLSLKVTSLYTALSISNTQNLIGGLLTLVGSPSIFISGSRNVGFILVSVESSGDEGVGFKVLGSSDIIFSWFYSNLTGANSTLFYGEECQNVTIDTGTGTYGKYFADLRSGELKVNGDDPPESHMSIYSGAKLTIENFRILIVRDETNTTAVEGADLLFTVDGAPAYSTEHYGNNDPKSRSDGRFLLYLVKKIYDGTNTSRFATNNLKVWYGGGDVEREVMLNAVDANGTSAIYVLLPDFEAPNPPRNVTAEALSEESVKISFNESNSTDVVGYKIYGNESGGWSLILNTTAAGDYVIDNLTPDKEYWFKVVAVDDAGIESEGIIVNATTPPPTKGTLSGWVLYYHGPLDGKNVTGAAVTLYNSTGVQVATTLLGEDGRFTFRNVTFSDGYRLEVVPPNATRYGSNVSGYTVWMGLLNFTQDREMVISIRYYQYIPPTEGTLSGGVTYSGGPEDGNKSVGATVEIYSGDTLVKSVPTDENGTFELQNFSFGLYRVVVIPPEEVSEGGNRSGYLRNETEINFTADSNITVTLQYYNYIPPPPPPSHPKIRILDEDGNPLEGVVVKARVNTTEYSAVTDKNGWANFTDYNGDFPEGTHFSGEKQGYEGVEWTLGEPVPPMKKKVEKGGVGLEYLYVILAIIVILVVVVILYLIKKKGAGEEE